MKLRNIIAEEQMLCLNMEARHKWVTRKESHTKLSYKRCKQSEFAQEW